MSQETIRATDKMDVPVKEQPFQKEFPLPKVVIERATGAGQNAFTTVLGWWRSLPPERQRLLGLVGLSVALSVTMSLVATVIARLVGKKN
jgi:hypothetical protein